MNEQKRPQAKQIKVTQEQLRAAFERASQNAKHWPVWKSKKNLNQDRPQGE